MNKNRHSFDSKCLELAEHFMPAGTPDRQAELAQCIQDAVEEFCEMEEAGLNPVAYGSKPTTK